MGHADQDPPPDALTPPVSAEAPVRQLAPDVPLGGSPFPPIADYAADHVRLRTVRCVNGEVEVVLDCEPAFDYGLQPAHWEYIGSGYREGVARCEGLELEVKLRTDLNLGFEGPRATARHRMKE